MAGLLGAGLSHDLTCFLNALISLFDGFAIVTALDLHLGPVVVAFSAVAGVAVGVFAIRTATKREQAGPLGQNSVDLAS
jgi:hypothetical protein